MSTSTQDTSVSIHIDDSSDQTHLKPKKKSHSHADDHDHKNCGHDHGHGGHSHGGHGGHSHGGRNKWFMSHGLEIKAFVYGVITSVWAITFFYLVEPLAEGGFDRFSSRIAITFFALMAQISYYRCTALKSGNPTKNVPVHAPPGNTNTCKNCSFWKPERTHHCSACNECVLRMDHHCPWINNCVGYKNHKSFILFCLYCAIGTFYFDYRTIYYIVVKWGNDTFFDLSITFLVFWFLVTMIACPGGLMVSGLGLYHLSLAGNNLTTLEAMGGANMKSPCDSKATREKKFTNKWDSGFLANLFVFFGNTYFFWWFPTSPATAYEAQHFNQLPNPTPTEILEFLRGKDAPETPEEKIMKPKSLAEVDLENIFKIAEEFTKDKHMQFYNVMLEIGKRRDQTFKAPAENSPVRQPVPAQNQQAVELSSPQEPQAQEAAAPVEEVVNEVENNHQEVVDEVENNQQEVVEEEQQEEAQQVVEEQQEEAQQVVEEQQEEETQQVVEEEQQEVQPEVENQEGEAEVVNGEEENLDQEGEKKEDEGEQGGSI